MNLREPETQTFYLNNTSQKVLTPLLTTYSSIQIRRIPRHIMCVEIISTTNRTVCLLERVKMCTSITTYVKMWSASTVHHDPRGKTKSHYSNEKRKRVHLLFFTQIVYCHASTCLFRLWVHTGTHNVTLNYLYL